MRRFLLFAIATCFTTACGGGQSVEPTARPDRSTATAQTLGEHGDPEADDPAGENEFQVRDSDTAGEAHGDRPSQIEATATHAAMRLFVVNGDDEPIEGIVIKMTAPGGAVYYTAETDSVGYGEVLVPNGQEYQMEYLSLGRENTAARVTVQPRPNLDLRLTMRYRRIRPAEEEQTQGGIALDGILFATNRATIEPESFPRIDRVVEYMTHRTSTRIRISGHTDNVGNPRRNQRLSEQRAQAVREYLVSHGIDAARIEAVGEGDQRPVASNDTDQGREQNRRIEAVEL